MNYPEYVYRKGGSGMDIVLIKNRVAVIVMMNVLGMFDILSRASLSTLVFTSRNISMVARKLVSK